MQWKCAIAAVAVAIFLAPSMAQADAVGLVEGARAKERQGRWLNGVEREQLRRWGGGESYGRHYSYGPYDHGYYGGDYYDHGPVYYYRSYPY